MKTGTDRSHLRDVRRALRDAEENLL